MKPTVIAYQVATAVVAGEQLPGEVTDLIRGGTNVVIGQSYNTSSNDCGVIHGSFVF